MSAHSEQALTASDNNSATGTTNFNSAVGNVVLVLLELQVSRPIADEAQTVPR